MTNLIRSLTLILTLLIASSSSFAQDQAAAEKNEERTEVEGRARYGAAMGGAAIMTSSGSSGTYFVGTSRIGFGLFRDKGGIFTLGLALSAVSTSDTVAGVTVKQAVIPLQVELLSRRSFNTGLYFGARAGVAFTAVEATLGNIKREGSGGSFTWAPVVGYEIPVLPWLAIPVELSWQTVLSGNAGPFSYDTRQAVLIQSGAVFQW